jgi:4-hydroxyphenylacetate 3-monooxygenase
VIRTGAEYRESIRDGREVWIDGQRVDDVATHPAFKPIVDVRARVYDMAHEPETQDVMSYVDPDSGERCAVGPKLPTRKDDWLAKRRAVDAVLDDIGGVVTRVGDETVGEMWALFDGQDVLAEIDPRFSEHIRDHVQRAAVLDPFHVSANTDPKGDRARRPQDQDPDVLLHVVRETDDGIVVRGAKFETAAAYANQAFVKPTIGDWGNEELSDYAVGFIVPMGAPGIKHICRSGFAGTKPIEDYPLTNRFDEVDTLIVFDDVEIPWEDVLFYRHTRAASFMRATLHRYSQFAFVQRHLRYADLLVGAAYASVAQTGVKMHQGVREKVAELVCYREGINAHLTAAVEHAERSPGGLLMPNQALLYTGRVFAGSGLPAAVHTARDLCGGQMCVTPSAASFQDAQIGPWLDKYYRIGEIEADDRRKLLAFARDLMDSDYAGHRLTFQLFAQSPPFAHLLAVYNNYDFTGPLDLVRKAADLSEDAVPARMESAGV